MRSFHLFALALLLCCACPSKPVPGPVVPPWPDASDAAALGDSPSSPCADACQRMGVLGCTEGSPYDCPTVMAHLDGAGLIRTECGAAECPPMTCAAVAQARSVTELRALGVRCGGAGP